MGRRDCKAAGEPCIWAAPLCEDKNNRVERTCSTFNGIRGLCKRNAATMNCHYNRKTKACAVPKACNDLTKRRHCNIAKFANLGDMGCAWKGGVCRVKTCRMISQRNKSNGEAACEYNDSVGVCLEHGADPVCADFLDAKCN